MSSESSGSPLILANIRVQKVSHATRELVTSARLCTITEMVETTTHRCVSSVRLRAVIAFGSQTSKEMSLNSLPVPPIKNRPNHFPLPTPGAAD